jgi:hypothetical protein
MTDELRRELQRLEAAIAHRNIVVRTVLEPIFAPGAGRYDLPIAWRAGERHVRISQPPKETSK